MSSSSRPRRISTSSARRAVKASRRSPFCSPLAMASRSHFRAHSVRGKKAPTETRKRKYTGKWSRCPRPGTICNEYAAFVSKQQSATAERAAESTTT